MVSPVHLITVDTECSSHPGTLGLTGQVGQEEVGALKIAEICRRYGVRATFFVDVYEGQPARAALVRDICRRIQDEGHDVQLHTHPDGLYDRTRGFMALYSLEEQVEIIHHGVQIFNEWFGLAPVAHRAGDWGANADTLRALQRNGMTVDSSLFFGWPTCQLTLAAHPRNGPVVEDGLLELPPTIFYSPGFGVFAPYRLLGTNGNSLREVLSVLERLHREPPAVTMSVFHSFSLLGWNASRTKYWVARDEIKKFERFVRAIGEGAAGGVLTVRELCERYRRDPGSIVQESSADIPQSSAAFVFPRLVNRLQRHRQAGMAS